MYNKRKCCLLLLNKVLGNEGDDAHAPRLQTPTLRIEI